MWSHHTDWWVFIVTNCGGQHQLSIKQANANDTQQDATSDAVVHDIVDDSLQPSWNGWESPGIDPCCPVSRID